MLNYADSLYFESCIVFLLVLLGMSGILGSSAFLHISLKPDNKPVVVADMLAVLQFLPSPPQHL